MIFIATTKGFEMPIYENTTHFFGNIIDAEKNTVIGHYSGNIVDGYNGVVLSGGKKHLLSAPYKSDLLRKVFNTVNK